MILDDLQEIIDNAKCPNEFPEDLNIGGVVFLDGKSYEWTPDDNCDAFVHIKEYKDNAGIYIHTHGISVQIGDTNVNIHNSQIVVFDYWHFDDIVEYRRSDSRKERIMAGFLLAGPIVGATLGLASSFGKGKKHLKCDNVVIAFWDVKTRTLQVINLQESDNSEPGSVKNMIDNWKRQIQINAETGRKPIGDNKAGVSEASGCMLLLIAGITPLLVLGYVLIESLIC